MQKTSITSAKQGSEVTEVAKTGFPATSPHCYELEVADFPAQLQTFFRLGFSAESRSNSTKASPFPYYDQSLILLRKIINPPIFGELFFKRKFGPAITRIILTQVALLKGMQ